MFLAVDYFSVFCRYYECVNDCSTAIDLLRPSCRVVGDRQNPHTSEEAYLNVCKLIKLLMRRGAAEAQLGNFGAAVSDHKVAVDELAGLEVQLSLLTATAVDREESVLLDSSWLSKNMKDVNRSSILADVEKLETLLKAGKWFVLIESRLKLYLRYAQERGRFFVCRSKPECFSVEVLGGDRTGSCTRGLSGQPISGKNGNERL